MKIERFEVPGLAQYSYVISDGGVAAVIDPIRDIDRYMDYAATQGLPIRYVLETHIHADFALWLSCSGRGHGSGVGSAIRRSSAACLSGTHGE